MFPARQPTFRLVDFAAYRQTLDSAGAEGAHTNSGDGFLKRLQKEDLHPEALTHIQSYTVFERFQS